MENDKKSFHWDAGFLWGRRRDGDGGGDTVELNDPQILLFNEIN